MSILTGPEIERIHRTCKEGDVPFILINPFNPDHVGPNSYDVTLGDTIRFYDDDGVIDPKEDQSDKLRTIRIPRHGWILSPRTLYLGSTVEYTETHGLVPYIDGRSSIGRLGISVHVTAGRGDDGFCGKWTLEITVVHPVKVYAGMRIGQLTYHTIEGPRKPYSGRYQNQLTATPSRFCGQSAGSQSC